MIGSIEQSYRYNPQGIVGSVRFLLAACEARLRLWRLRAATRAELRDLPPERLRDLGMTGAEAAREAARPFWS